MPEAAKINTEILKRHDWNFQKAIDTQENSIMQAGSEYRPLDDLECIFKHHKDWEKLKVLLSKGVVYGFDKNSKEYSGDTQKSDLAAQLKKGNSKSTKGCEKIIHKNYKKEITRAWMVPF